MGERFPFCNALLCWSCCCYAVPSPSWARSPFPVPAQGWVGTMGRAAKPWGELDAHCPRTNMLARPVHPSICLSIHPSGLGYVQPLSLHPPPAWLPSRASVLIPVTYLSLQLSLNCFGSPSEGLPERESSGDGEWKGWINEPMVLDGGVGSKLGCLQGAALADGCPWGQAVTVGVLGSFVAQRHHGTRGVVTLPRLSSAQGQAGCGGSKDKTKTSPAHVFN